MKIRELVRYLEAHGCHLLREGSKHTQYVNPSNKKHSSVPRHNEINNFLVRKICRDLGIPEP